MGEPTRPNSVSQDTRYAWIPDHEGRYAITDDGRVFSYVKNWQTTSGAKPMKLKSHKQGYKEIGLNVGGKQDYFLVHRLVLETFVGPAPDGHVCCHGNGVPDDNRLSNLRWDTVSANWRDAAKHGTAARGERQGTSKLTRLAVLQIRRDYATGNFTQYDLAESHGVDQAVIWKVVNGKGWKHVGGPINGIDYDTNGGNSNQKIKQPEQADLFAS